MDAWVVWIILGVVLLVGEVMTLSFFLGPFGVGALAAGATAAATDSDALPWVVFIVLSVLVLAVVRPIARAHSKTPGRLRTGTAALVGRDALVVEAIEGPERTGRVKIDGDVWTARSYDGEEYAAGAQVQVMEIRGATALVN